MFKTRKLVFVAILGSLSFLLMLVSFPILPGADFLKLNFSILPILLALTLFDLKAAYAVLFVRSLLKLVLDSGNLADVIGLPMNVIAVAVFVFCFAKFWRHHQTWSGFLKSSLVGSLCLTLVMLLLNVVYAVPVYAAVMQFDIGEVIGLTPYLLTMVLPFNLLQGVLFSISFALLLVPMQPIMERYGTPL